MTPRVAGKLSHVPLMRFKLEDIMMLTPTNMRIN